MISRLREFWANGNNSSNQKFYFKHLHISVYYGDCEKPKIFHPIYLLLKYLFTNFILFGCTVSISAIVNRIFELQKYNKHAQCSADTKIRCIPITAIATLSYLESLSVSMQKKNSLNGVPNYQFPWCSFEKWPTLLSQKKCLNPCKILDTNISAS